MLKEFQFKVFIYALRDHGSQNSFTVAFLNFHADTFGELIPQYKTQRRLYKNTDTTFTLLSKLMSGGGHNSRVSGFQSSAVTIEEP